MRKLLVLVVLLVLGLYAAGALLFLAREDEPVGSADAVVVLAGGETRLHVALELVRGGVAPTLVVSQDDSGEDPERSRLCARGELQGAELVCRTAEPYSTRGEARLVARLAEQRGWDRIVIVTSRYHLFRAERLFERCLDAGLVMRGADESLGRKLIAIPFEWAKLALAETLRRGC